MAQFLVRRANSTAVVRIDDDRLVVEFPTKVGGGIDSSIVRIRQILALNEDGTPKEGTVEYITELPTSRAADFIRRPGYVDAMTIDMLDAEVKTAEVNLQELKRRRDALVSKVFEDGSPVAPVELQQAATNRLILDHIQ